MVSDERVMTLKDKILLVALTIGSIVSIAGLRFLPGHERTALAVIFPPWTHAISAIESATNAGARVVKVGWLPFVVIVQPDALSYTQTILRNGALMVLDAQAIRGCLGTTSQL